MLEEKNSEREFFCHQYELYQNVLKYIAHGCCIHLFLILLDGIDQLTELTESFGQAFDRLDASSDYHVEPRSPCAYSSYRSLRNLEWLSYLISTEKDDSFTQLDVE